MVREHLLDEWHLTRDPKEEHPASASGGGSQADLSEEHQGDQGGWSGMSDRVIRDETREVTRGQTHGRIWPLMLSELEAQENLSIRVT